ncbi:MAG TPA: hypothetical protein DCQ32_03915 [Cyanobacteria bacterium UBA8156]|jgi:Uma2 family endonuclease|nr:hypothetical protein [Cyanobacteria bacterium UBA8156]
MSAATLPVETATAVSFAQFIAEKPEGQLCELHQGVLYPMPQPVGQHENVASFLIEQLTLVYTQHRLPYRIPKTVLVRSADGTSAYLPDILVLNRDRLPQEPLWEKASTVTQGTTIPLVVEIVSSNWRVDYFTKAKDYEEIGILEYWIVDYAGLGGRRFIGDDKPPTVSVYHLVEGEYQVALFRGDDRLVSPTFPELALTANQIFRGDGG